MVMSGRPMARKSSGSTVMSSPRSRVAPEDAGRAKRGDPVGRVPQQLAQDRIGVVAEARRARRTGDGALAPERRCAPVVRAVRRVLDRETRTALAAVAGSQDHTP